VEPKMEILNEFFFFVTRCWCCFCFWWCRRLLVLTHSEGSSRCWESNKMLVNLRGAAPYQKQSQGEKRTPHKHVRKLRKRGAWLGHTNNWLDFCNCNKRAASPTAHRRSMWHKPASSKHPAPSTADWCTRIL